MSQLRIFVSHSHDDDAFASRLVADLCGAGAHAWLDKNELGAGDFQERINAALADCEWFVLVLTRNALASVWVKQEVNAANIRKHQRQLSNLIFIKAGPVEHTELPPLWGVYNIFDATADYALALDSTLRAVGLLEQTPIIPPDRFPQRLADLGFTPHSSNGVGYILPPLCTVPAGPFLMGSDPARDPVAIKESWTDREKPQHTVTLPVYEIARYPVTVAEYACFVRTGHRKPNYWQTQQSKPDYPVVAVTWHDAVAYASWVAGLTKKDWRLPTEAEWEKAARGTDGRIYPWGDTFDQARCNTKESGIGTITPVGNYPAVASPCGAQDMAGNVWEWTSSRWLPYPYTTAGERGDSNSPGNRVLRGGAWGSDARVAHVAHRNVNQSTEFNDSYGFRLVQATPSS